VKVIGREPAPMAADFATQIARGQVWVMRSGAELCGFIVFYQRDAAMFLENVAVHPKWHGTGVGKHLITFCETTARDLGLMRVKLYTNVAMARNLTLYPHLGYRETDRRSEDGFQRVYFEKRL
jgi:GNAT superfamily N-acetyltransferase